MIVQVFSLYDTVAGAFQLPFFQHNRALAIQFVCDQLDDAAQNRLRKHASTLILHHIGEFDDSTAVFTSVHPVSLGVLSEWLSPPSPPPSSPSLHSAA